MNKIQIKISALSVLFFSFITHGYRFFNNMYSHDALFTIYQHDYAWQIALGRFVQPLLIFFRGSLCNPWLISFCTVFWIFLSVYFAAEVLDIHHPVGITLIAAILVCNTTTIVANASFLPWVDFYALACFSAVFGVWCLKMGLNASKGKMIFGCTLGTLSLSFSMGIYQSYICVAIGLVMIDLLAELRKSARFKDFIKKTLCFVVSLLAAALIYYVLWKISQKIFNVWTSDSYNGLADVGDYSDTSVFSVLRNTYRQVFDFFWSPDTFKSLEYKGYSFMNIWRAILRGINLVIVAYILIRSIHDSVCKKNRLWHNLLQAVIFLLFPLGINFVSFISKGMEHPLMVFAFVTVYLLALQLCQPLSMSDLTIVTGKPLFKYANVLILTVPLAILLWSNVVYANQVYLKKELQDEATQAMMSRIVYAIESADGYIAGETPVAFSGNFQTSDYVQELADFEEIVPYGMGKSTATYIGTDYALLTHVLNVNMSLTRLDTSNVEFKKQLDEMPCYPDEGSIRYIGETLVVKISD